MTDIRRDSPLFTQKLNVTLFSASQEENEESSLVLQVLPGTRQHSNGQQENFLHFEITNDIDLYFLYTLDIGEHDFHNLKREQHIVVDFLGFPAKFIGLVNMCVQHQQHLAGGGANHASSSDNGNGTASHFVTKLNLTSGVLSIVEVNEFNHVSHLNLQFRPGSDDSIKAYLSSSLKFATEAKNTLRREKEKLTSDLERAVEGYDGVSEELRLLRENTERDEQCQQARHEQALAQLQQTHMQTLSDVRQQADDTLDDLRRSKELAAQKSSDRISELEKELAETDAGKREAEFTVRKLQSEVEKSAAESAFYNASHTDSAAMLRARDQEVADLERALAKVTAKKEALEGQIEDKEEILRKASSLREAAEQSRQNALDQLDLYKTGLASAQEKLQSAVGEIRRGNEAIQQLQRDLQACKSKLQSKNEVIRKQDSLVQELRTRVAELSRVEAKLRDDIAIGAQKKELVERELATAQASIEEGADIIQKNQEVITHLNEMINSLQLGGGVGSSGAAGMSSWSTPVQPPRAEQQSPQQGHFSYHSPASGQQVGADTEAVEYSLPPAGPKPVAETGESHQRNKYVNKVSPDSVAFSSPHYQDNTTFRRARHVVSDQHPPSQRYSLSPQYYQSKLDAGSGQGEESQKGYYDGVLDSRLLEPSANSRMGQLKTHSPSTDYITGITKSNRSKPAAYSWQLDDFGREGE